MPRFETPGTTRIVVVNPLGDVELTDDGDGVTTVELVAIGADADSLIGETTVVHHESAGTHVVTVTLPAPRVLSRRRHGVGVRISAPSGSQVSVSAHASDRSLLSMMRDGSGTVTLHGTFGDLDVALPTADVACDAIAGAMTIKTASGGVDAKRVQGEVKVRTVSGDVRIGDAAGDVSVAVVSGDISIASVEGAVDATSISGDVVISDVRGGATIKTTSGAVVVRRVWETGVTAVTVSGDVIVGIPQGRTINVDARSVSGSLSSDIDLDSSVADQSASSVPALRITANSVSGDVQIRRAQAA